MTEFEMMKKMMERLSSEIGWDWYIKDNIIYIDTGWDDPNDWVSFEFDKEGKAVKIK